MAAISSPGRLHEITFETTGVDTGRFVALSGGKISVDTRQSGQANQAGHAKCKIFKIVCTTL
jgi:hypothetical protein